MLNEFLT
jgi:hypothetical protein